MLPLLFKILWEIGVDVDSQLSSAQLLHTAIPENGPEKAGASVFVVVTSTCFNTGHFAFASRLQYTFQQFMINFVLIAHELHDLVQKDSATPNGSCLPSSLRSNHRTLREKRSGIFL